MANDTEMITTKTVVDLDEKTTPADTDLFMAGNAGTATLKKLKWSSMLAAIKTKIAEWTFQTLNTSDKTIPGALNELNNKIVTNTVLNPSGLDKYPMVLYVHKNILSDSQGIHANVEYEVDGTTNSFVMIGTRINPSRGRYLIMSRTTQDLVSTRIISEDTIGVLRVTMDGSETKYTLS